MKTVRIFRYDKSSGKYSYADYSCTAATEERRAVKNSGVYRKGAGSIRIMTQKEIDVRPGDYVSIGGTAETPDKDTDLMITAVRDNRRGRTPHWRMIANGRVRF